MTSPTAQARRPRRASAAPLNGLPKPVRRRRPLLVLVGLVLAASAAALVAALLNAATATTLVWATAADVSRGHPVAPEELVAVELSASAAERLVEATTESRDGLIGRVWAVDLPAGELLSPALVTERLVVADGQALVGLQLGPGEFPVAGLRPGDVVMVVVAGAKQGESPRGLVESAGVESIAVLGDQGVASARLVTLSVPASAAAAVANAGSAGRASIAVAFSSTIPSTFFFKLHSVENDWGITPMNPQ
jgi:hypothetical protein